MPELNTEQRERLARRIALAFEGWGQAWWTDDSGDVLAGVAADAVAEFIAEAQREAAQAVLNAVEQHSDSRHAYPAARAAAAKYGAGTAEGEPKPGTLAYARMVAEQHGDLEDAADEDGYDGPAGGDGR